MYSECQELQYFSLTLLLLVDFPGYFKLFSYLLSIVFHLLFIHLLIPLDAQEYHKHINKMWHFQHKPTLV